MRTKTTNHPRVPAPPCGGNGGGNGSAAGSCPGSAGATMERPDTFLEGMLMLIDMGIRYQEGKYRAGKEKQAEAVNQNAEDLPR